MAKNRAARVGELADALDRIAPPSLAQSWDQVGLLAGDRAARCKRVLLCIDLTPLVLEEAIQSGCELVVAYHPPVFRPIQRLLAEGDGIEALVFRAVRAGIAIYSPHTALDAAAGGTNDVIADLCALQDVGPFEYVTPGGRQCKLVTFVPEAQVEGVASSIFAAGAGRIGEYEQCSYRVFGEGTFFGSESTNPKVGKRGRLERVKEVRIEVLVPESALPGVISALRGSHPYEEPAFDVYPLSGAPVPGIGRVGMLPPGTTLAALARTLRRKTASRVVTVVGSGDRQVRKAAVCVGAAGRLPLERPLSADCDVIITGEIRHHDALTILRAGKTAIALGHWESERPVLQPLAQRLRKMLPGVTFHVSHADAPPFQPA